MNVARVGPDDWGSARLEIHQEHQKVQELKLNYVKKQNEKNREKRNMSEKILEFFHDQEKKMEKKILKQTTVFNVNLPQGTKAGQTITFDLPNTKQLVFTVPEEYVKARTFTVTVEPEIYTPLNGKDAEIAIKKYEIDSMIRKYENVDVEVFKDYIEMVQNAKVYNEHFFVVDSMDKVKELVILYGSGNGVQAIIKYAKLIKKFEQIKKAGELFSVVFEEKEALGVDLLESKDPVTKKHYIHVMRGTKGFGLWQKDNVMDIPDDGLLLWGINGVHVMALTFDDVNEQLFERPVELVLRKPSPGMADTAVRRLAESMARPHLQELIEKNKAGKKRLDEQKKRLVDHIITKIPFHKELLGDIYKKNSRRGWLEWLRKEVDDGLTRMVAIHKYTTPTPGRQITMNKRDIMVVKGYHPKGWFKGYKEKNGLKDSEIFFFPQKSVERLSPFYYKKTTDLLGVKEQTRSSFGPVADPHYGVLSVPDYNESMLDTIFKTFENLEKIDEYFPEIDKKKVKALEKLYGFEDTILSTVLKYQGLIESFKNMKLYSEIFQLEHEQIKEREMEEQESFLTELHDLLQMPLQDIK